MKIKLNMILIGFIATFYGFQAEAFRPAPLPLPTETIRITSDYGHNGLEESLDVSGGTAYIFSSADGVFDQPVIFVEGYDPNNTQNFYQLTSYLNQFRLLSDLRSQGKDVVVLNFHDSNRPIQQNAFVLVKLIQEVNARKVGLIQNVVAGVSMGGIVSRYALTFMEAENLRHDTSLYVSHDVPHKGAVLPFGLIWAYGTNESILGGVSFLDQIFEPIVAQQLLLINAVQGGPSYRSLLLQELEEMGGYPNSLIKVAFANGSAHGVSQSYVEGEKLYEWQYRSGSYTRTRWYRSFDTDGLLEQQFPAELIKPYDTAPGGLYDIFQQVDNELRYQSGIRYTSLFHPYHSFVHTVSALDIDTENLFYMIAEDENILEKTPFDEIYFPSSGVNEIHARITFEKKEQFIDVINRHQKINITPLLPAILLVSM